VEERVVRSTRTVVIRCFKCGEKEHKCRECSLWEKKLKRVAHPDGRKAHQGERRLACPIREKVQEGEKRLRRMEEEKAACPVKEEAQQEWRRSLIEELRKKAEEHYGKGIPREA